MGIVSSRVPTKALSPAQRGAAALEVSGANTAEIARSLGVATGTISSWRKEPLYSVAIDELGRRSADDLQPIVNRIRNELAQGLLVAIKGLLDNMEAINEDGHPLYSVRQAAFATMLSHADLVAAKPGGGEGGSQAAAQAEVRVTISDAALGDASPFHVESDAEVVDAEVVEPAE